MGKPIQLDEMPLHPHILINPFEKWALDFVGLINPPSKQKGIFLFAQIILQNG